MKKVLSCILALTMLLTMSVNALAAVNPDSGSTRVTYNVGNSYTITIPNDVSITGASATQEVKINNQSIIPADKSLQFKITDSTNYDSVTSKFRMKNNVGTDVYLNYAITNGETPVIKDTAFLSATASEAYAGKSVTLTYTPDAAQSAGEYSDALTFAVSLV